MCDCIKTVDEKLNEAGHNTRIKLPLMIGGGAERPMVETEKADRDVRKKPISVFATFCPFCGDKLSA